MIREARTQVDLIIEALDIELGEAWRSCAYKPKLRSSAGRVGLGAPILFGLFFGDHVFSSKAVIEQLEVCCASLNGDNGGDGEHNNNDDDDAALGSFCRLYERALALRQLRLATRSKSQKGVDQINGEFWRFQGPACSIEQRIKPMDIEAAWKQEFPPAEANDKGNGEHETDNENGHENENEGSTDEHQDMENEVDHDNIGRDQEQSRPGPSRTRQNDEQLLALGIESIGGGEPRPMRSPDNPEDNQPDCLQHDSPDSSVHEPTWALDDRHSIPELEPSPFGRHGSNAVYDDDSSHFQSIEVHRGEVSLDGLEEEGDHHCLAPTTASMLQLTSPVSPSCRAAPSQIFSSPELWATPQPPSPAVPDTIGGTTVVSLTPRPSHLAQASAPSAVEPRRKRSNTESSPDHNSPTLFKRARTTAPASLASSTLRGLPSGLDFLRQRPSTVRQGGGEKLPGDTWLNDDAWLTDDQVVAAVELFASCQRRARCVSSLQQVSWGYLAGDDAVQKFRDEMLNFEDEKDIDILLPCNIQQTHWALAHITCSQKQASEQPQVRIRITDSLFMSPLAAQLPSSSSSSSPSSTATTVAASFANKYLMSTATTHTWSGQQQSQQGDARGLPEIGPTRIKEWDIEVVPSIQQDDQSSCGIFTIVSAVRLLMGTDLEASVNKRIWRRFLYILVTAYQEQDRGRIDPQKLAAVVQDPAQGEQHPTGPGARAGHQEPALERGGCLSVLLEKERQADHSTPQMRLEEIVQPGPGATLADWDKYSVDTTAQLSQLRRSMTECFSARVRQIEALLAAVRELENVVQWAEHGARLELSRVEGLVESLERETGQLQTIINSMPSEPGGWVHVRVPPFGMKAMMEKEAGRLKHKMQFWGVKRRTLLHGLTSLLPDLATGLAQDEETLQGLRSEYKKIVEKWAPARS